jgi:hypothetical protein
MCLHGLLREQLYFLYSDNVRTSQETLLSASTACYGDSFTSLYVNDVHTTQETLLYASTACYEIALLFYM